MPLFALIAALAFPLAHSNPEICFDLARAQAQNEGAKMVAETDLQHQTEVRAALTKAFERYPDGFLSQNVKTVYVVREMADEDVPYGGTTGDDGRSVLITDGDEDGVDPGWVRSVFHHETAHVLMDNYADSFSRRAWRAATAKGFRYAHREDGGYWSIKNGEADDAFLPELNAQGPLNAYGASCFEEDWAVYAQNVLEPSPEFAERVRRYPLMARRAALVEAFYEKICPGWTPSTLTRTSAGSL